MNRRTCNDYQVENTVSINDLNQPVSPGDPGMSKSKPKTESCRYQSRSRRRRNSLSDRSHMGGDCTHRDRYTPKGYSTLSGKYSFGRQTCTSWLNFPALEHLVIKGSTIQSFEKRAQRKLAYMFPVKCVADKAQTQQGWSNDMIQRGQCSNGDDRVDSK